MSDLLSRLLQDVRPSGAVFDRSFMREGWALRFADGPSLTLLALLGGDGWVIPGDRGDEAVSRTTTPPTPAGFPVRTGDRGDEAVPLRQGNVAIVVGPEPYVVGERPDTPVQVVVYDGDRCTTSDGRDLATVPSLETVCCDADGEPGTAALLKGAFHLHSSLRRRLLDGLPRMLVVPGDHTTQPLLTLLDTELTAERQGRQAVLERLLELLLVAALRAWLDQPAAKAPAWYYAQRDPVVGTALRLMHDDPAHPWTVAELARRASVSRAAFARRFTQLVGEPPMAYLMCWRVCTAADLLRQTDATIGAIARQVGYANADALSVAFKRIFGVRPSTHRTAA